MLKKKIQNKRKSIPKACPPSKSDRERPDWLGERKRETCISKPRQREIKI